MGTVPLLGMTALGIDNDGGIGLLLTLPAGPVLLRKNDVGKWVAERLDLNVAQPPSAVIRPPEAGEIGPKAGRSTPDTGVPQSRPEDELKHPAPCVVADLDGDGLPDVLAPFANGSLLYRGTGIGRFARPVRCAIFTDGEHGRATVGDFDQDGLLDVFTVPAEATVVNDVTIQASGGPRLWQNLGGGRFEDRIGLSGEIAYITKPDATDVHVWGRQQRRPGGLADRLSQHAAADIRQPRVPQHDSGPRSGLGLNAV